MKKLLIAILALSIIFLFGQAIAQNNPTRAITQIRGDLYRFQNNYHFSVFLVTPDGIIATDPIDKEAAVWLKTELKKRFNKPVKYLIYSHDHRDHIAGGEVLADGAIVIAHEKAKVTIIGEQRPTAVPNITFSDRMTVELGGKRVELIYVGLSHSDNLIAMHFPAERAVFVVDFISVKRLPYKDLSDSYFPDWIEAVKVVEAIDFNILIPGHGTVGTKSDAVEHREYLQSLYNTVLKAAREGRTLEEMKQTILNIEGVYKSVSLHRRGN
jgi:glyoxylase-like metal-dependent hydrolase (beta-lactamase superfamily II)